MTVDAGTHPPQPETYLGDGLYASFDGYQICLRAPRGYHDDYVYLDPPTFQALVDYNASIRSRRQ